MMQERTCQEHYPQILRFIQSRLKDEAAAADLTQDVFVKAQQKFDTLQQPDRVQSWLFSIANHAITDHFRRKNRRPEQFGSGMEDAAYADTTASDQNFMDQPCMPECMQYMIGQLPEQHREILDLAEFQGISQRVLAEQLQMPYPTVKSKVQRAREHLRKEILKCCAVITDSYGNILDMQPKGNYQALRHKAAIDQICQKYKN